MAETQKEVDGEKSKVLVHLLVVLVGVTSWSIMNGLWVQLPILVAHLPEGWTLPSFLTITSQFGNLGPLTFVLLSWLFPKRKLETPVSVAVVIALMVCAGLYAFLWKETATLGGVHFSVALLVITLCMSIFAATSSMSYLAFMSHLKARYISSIFIGQGLSGLIPAFIAIGQGAGDVRCLTNVSHLNDGENSDWLNELAANPNETTVVAVNTEPRFSIQTFFLILVAMGLVSLAALLLLIRHPYCRTEHVNVEEEENCQLLQANTQRQNDEKKTALLSREESVPSYDQPTPHQYNTNHSRNTPTDLENGHSNKTVTIVNATTQNEEETNLNTNTYNISQKLLEEEEEEEDQQLVPQVKFQNADYDEGQKLNISPEPRPNNSEAGGESQVDQENQGEQSIKRWESWYLLCLLVWINVLQTSYVLAIQVYSSLPYGLAIYNGVTKAENIVDPLACCVTLFVTAQRTKVISGLTLLGTLFAAYIITVAAMSPHPFLVNETMGGILVILAWVMCTVLMVYSKVSIASVMRNQGRKSLIWTGGSSQLGALIGAILAYVMINQLDLFKDGPWC